jgi:hypothetical protein
MRSAPRGQHSPVAPVALRIKSVELNRSPLWGLYHAAGWIVLHDRVLRRRAGDPERQRLAFVALSLADRGVICSLAREGGLRPR